MNEIKVLFKSISVNFCHVNREANRVSYSLPKKELIDGQCIWGHLL